MFKIQRQEIIFSHHALYQMNERNISRQTVIDALNFPNCIITQNNQRKQAIKFFLKNQKKYLIIAIYEENLKCKNVITAFITSKIKKYL
ncbi:MAG: DUF4258 domain-containing protein [bacterium]